MDANCTHFNETVFLARRGVLYVSILCVIKYIIGYLFDLQHMYLHFVILNLFNIVVLTID
jgi:hypothetical protein